MGRDFHGPGVFWQARSKVFLAGNQPVGMFLLRHLSAHSHRHGDMAVDGTARLHAGRLYCREIRTGGHQVS